MLNNLLLGVNFIHIRTWQQKSARCRLLSNQGKINKSTHTWPRWRFQTVYTVALPFLTIIDYAHAGLAGSYRLFKYYFMVQNKLEDAYVV